MPWYTSARIPSTTSASPISVPLRIPVPPLLLPTRPSVYQLGSRSARNVAQQRQNEQNDKDIEKDLGHAGRRKSDSSKAKNCCYQCHDEKDQSPAQHKLNPPVHHGREQTQPLCQFPREVKIQLHAF